jgi:hypothetical protein
MYFVSQPEDAARNFPGGQQLELRRPPAGFFHIEERRSSHRAVCNGATRTLSSSIRPAPSIAPLIFPKLRHLAQKLHFSFIQTGRAHQSEGGRSRRRVLREKKGRGVVESRPRPPPWSRSFLILNSSISFSRTVPKSISAFPPKR